MPGSLLALEGAGRDASVPPVSGELGMPEFSPASSSLPALPSQRRAGYDPRISGHSHVPASRTDEEVGAELGGPSSNAREATWENPVYPSLSPRRLREENH